MNILATALVILTFFGSLAATSATVAAAEMALTFDDLPYVAAPYKETLPKAQKTTAAILDTLREFQAPATAFVNEERLQVPGEVDERIELLRQWIKEGATLGNHTFSHADLNLISIAEFQREIVKGEATIRKLMQGREEQRLYFRHPYTHTGDSEEKKRVIDQFLADRGYAVAPYTIDSQDYIFNIPYLAATESGDEGTARRLCRAYVDFVDRATAFAEGISLEIFDRDIPQIIILHANKINGDCLGELLSRLTEHEYEFVSLDEAMADPAYSTNDTLVTSYGPSWLWRWMKSKEMEVSFRGEPEPPDWVLALH